MHEHIARALYYVEVHLLFASLVWCAAWLLTSVRQGNATWKYWIWVAALLNLILPLGAVLDKVFAAHLAWARPLGFVGGLADEMSRPGWTSAALGAGWLVGASLMLARLVARLRTDHRDGRAAALDEVDSKRDFLVQGIPVRFGGGRHAPAVDGIWRPHILLPDGIERLLSRRELNAVLIHELTHARRRDNLIRLVHELSLCVLWFHPFAWITGSRLALYRELSCDDSVIERVRGGDLVSALAKLAHPQQGLLLRATASSHLRHRLARLTAARPERPYPVASILLNVLFAAVLAGGVVETVAHTACCFVVKAQR